MPPSGDGDSYTTLAARHDAAPRNTVRDTKPVATERKPVRALTEREVRSLRAKLAADRKAVAADLPDLVDYMLGTGVRIGEALALRWADLDLAAAAPIVTITGTVVRVPGRGLIIQDHPKTARGRRKLMLPAFVVAMLLRRRVDQVDGGDLVLPSSVGTLREPQNVHRQWRAARDRAGFDWVTPHVFRKSVATVIGLGDLRAAADQLGHSGTAVTERHYIQRTGAGPDARALLEVFAQPADEADRDESVGYPLDADSQSRA
jgi:integrase